MRTRRITFECWPRFSDAKDGQKGQFPGLPITVAMEDNDGYKTTGTLPTLVFKSVTNPVVQVIEEASGGILCTIRIQGNRFQPRVYGPGKFQVEAGRDKPDGKSLSGLEASSTDAGRELEIEP